jgi:uncharacterized protein (TIGR02996 family)
MTNEANFLAAIREDPDDDGVRLVYADWLEEHGDSEAQRARAEFIRVQIELKRLPEFDARRHALEDREADLLAVHEEAWLGDVPHNLELWRFERGFVEWVCPCQSHTEDGSLITLAGFDELFARHPIPSVSLHLHQSHSSSLLAESPWLERIRELEVMQSYGVQHGEPLRDLLVSPRLTALTSLELNSPRGGANCLGYLLPRPWASSLEKLGLCSLTDDGLTRLLAEPAFTRLTSIIFIHRTPPNAIALLTAPEQANRWTALDFERHALSAAALNCLERCEHLEHLRCAWPADTVDRLTLPASLTHLSFSYSRDRRVPPTALVELDCLPRLRRLDFYPGAKEGTGDADPAALADLLAALSGPVLHLRSEGEGVRLRDLAALPHLDRIGSLDLESRRLTDEDVEALAECVGLTNLRHLSLPCCELTTKQAKLLARSPALAGLFSLDLYDGRINNTGVRTLLASPYLSRLTHLDLGDNDLGPMIVKTLRDWPGLSRLRDLQLVGIKLDDRAMRRLLADKRFSALTRLEFARREVDRGALQEVAERFGCRLDV